MADKKVTALTSIGTGIAAADVWMVIDDVSGTPTNKKVAVQDFTRYLPSPLGFSQAPQALTAAGAVNITAAITTIATSGAIALTLIDGIAGQLKFITMVTQSGTATLTPTTLNGKSTIAFIADGDSVLLLFVNATHGWSIIANNGCTLA